MNEESKKLKCLQCGKVAVESEFYGSIPLRICGDGHRTGIYIEEINEKERFKEAV